MTYDIYGKCDVCGQSLDDGHTCPIPEPEREHTVTCNLRRSYGFTGVECEWGDSKPLISWVGKP